MPKIHNAPSASGKENWTTPRALYDRLDKEFSFTLDAAADASNALCSRFLSKDEGFDAFTTRWKGMAFCNPPYGYGVGKWVARAEQQAQYEGTSSVLLVPAATDTKWFHEIVAPSAREVRLLKGRLAFGNVVCKDGSIGVQPAPFPSMVIWFEKRAFWRPGGARIFAWDWRTQ